MLLWKCWGFFCPLFWACVGALGQVNLALLVAERSWVRLSARPTAIQQTYQVKRSP